MLRLACEEQALPFLRTPASSGKRQESQPTENPGHPGSKKRDEVRRTLWLLSRPAIIDQ